LNWFCLLQINVPPSNLAYLFAAFAVTWVVFFAYAFFISRRRQETQREVRDLQRTLGTPGEPRQPGPQTR
jgi:CcmD family protein